MVLAATPIELQGLAVPPGAPAETQEWNHLTNRVPARPKEGRPGSSIPLRLHCSKVGQQPETEARQQTEAGKGGPNQESFILVTQLDLVPSRRHLQRLEGIVGAPDPGRPAIHISFPGGIIGLGDDYQARGGSFGLNGYLLVGELCG